MYNCAVNIRGAFNNEYLVGLGVGIVGATVLSGPARVSVKALHFLSNSYWGATLARKAIIPSVLIGAYDVYHSVNRPSLSELLEKVYVKVIQWGVFHLGLLAFNVLLNWFAQYAIQPLF